MKKFYTTLARNDVKSLRSPYPLSLVKGVSFAAMVAFLSNVSPSFSANSDFRNAFLEGVNSAGVSYPQSIVSVAGLNASSVSKDNYLTALNKVGVEKVKASSDYASFLIRTLSSKSEDNSFAIPALESSYKSTGLDNDITTFNMGSQSIVSMSAMTRANRGPGGSNTVVLGTGAQTKMQHSIAIGYNAITMNEVREIAIGSSAQTIVSGGIALGAGSEAFIPGGVDAYRPLGISPTSNFSAWKSADGALSIGTAGASKTRQIVGVAGGTADTDAVNVAQLKALEKAAGSWKLSVGGANTTTVESNKLVDLTAASNNIKVTKGKDDNKVKFDLSRSVIVDKIQTGNNIFDATGLVIANGPKMTTGGIDAGSKKITGVAKGTGETDAVNFSQLKAVQEASVLKGLKINTSAKDFKDPTAAVENSIALGNQANASGENGIAIGSYAKVSEKGGVALGRDSVANRAAGVFGYAPSLVDEVAKNNGSQWKSTLGAVSVGDDANKKTRQITGVAAGSEATDAVNVTQLRDLKRFVKENGWKLSVGGENAKDVLMDSDVDFSAGSNNLNITKGKDDNKVKFDLAKDVELSSAKMGNNTLDATGLVISSGPKITTDGIGAGSKKITGLAKGTDDTDAVNKAQLDQDVTTLSDKIEDVRSVAVLYDEEADTEEVSAFTRSARKVNKKSVTFGDPKEGPVALHNVADGKIAKDSHDAVNGSQLFETNQNVATYFGGGAGYSEGTWTAPKFTVKSVKDDGVSEDKVYDDVASALTGVGTSLTNVQNKFTEQVNNVINKVESESFVQQDKTTHLLTIGAAAEGGEINIANKDKGDRILSGVKTATKDNEAVNKGQLDESLEKLSNSLQSDESAVVHYDKTGDENSTINYKSVTLGGKDKDPVGLHNVANGSISKDSRDAITGGQINTISQDVAKFLGGNASFENGTFKGPIYNLSSITTDGVSTPVAFTNVGTAFAGLDDNIKNVNQRIKEVSENVAHDSLLWNDDAQAFVARHEKSKEEHGRAIATQDNSKITFLLDGDVSKGSTDAVTGNQLHNLGAGVAKSLGGTASYENGTWTAPTFTVKSVTEDGKTEDKSYNNVASAFAGVGTSFTNVNNSITKIKNEITKEIADAKSDSLNWSETANAFVAQHGENKDSSKITSLQSGEISATSTDAVNGSQLYSLGTEVATYFGGGAGYAEGTWTAPTFTVKSFKNDGSVSDATYHDVASAFEGVGDSFTNVKNEITNVKNEITNVKGDSLVKWDDEKQIIKIGAEKGGNTITIADKDSKGRILSGVKAAEKSDEAVNKAQLDENVIKLSQDIEDVRSVAVFYDTEEDTEEVSALTRSARKANKKSVTFGNPSEGTVALRNVGIGEIAENSTDAVNGSQLHSLGDKVATYFGGGAKYENGQWVAPAFKVKTVKADGAEIEDKSYNDVASAFEGVGTSFTNITNEIKKEIATVQGDALLWSESDKAFVATHGENKNSSKITSLQNGEISANSTDAINGSQLYSLGDKVATYFGGGAGYKDGAFTGPTYKLSQISKDGDVTDNSFTEVGKAFEGLDTNIKNVNQRIKDVSQGVAQDSLLWSKEEEAFVARHGEGNDKNRSKIKFLAGGDLSKDSTDAVNGGQINTLGGKVAAFFGGGADFGNGNWNTPTFKFKTIKADGTEEDKEYQDVASAFAGVGTSFTDLHNAITKEINNAVTKVEGDSLVKQDKDTDSITIGKETNGTVINVANKNGVNRVISGVEDAKDNNDAVNKGQLDKGLKDLSNSLQSDDSAVVHYDKKGDDNNAIDYASVTLGKGKDSAAVGLHNVADGTIGEGSHDAITGGQVNTISQNIAKYLGGEAAFNNGTFTGPTYKLSKISEDGAAEKTSYDNVGSAFEGLDTNIKNVNQRIKEVSQGVAQDSLSWDKGALAFVAKHGEEKTNSKITFLANGGISAASTDAVNGSQLYSLGDKVAKSFGGGSGYTNGEWSAPSFTVKKFNADGSEGEDKSYTNVADALAGVSSSLTNIKNDITNVVSNSLVKWDEDKQIIKIGAEKYGNTITIADKDSKTRTLSGIKAAEQNDEAVNKAQLDENVDKLSKDIEEVRSVAVFYDTEEDAEELSALTRSARKAKQTSVTFGNPKEGTVALRNVGNGKIAKDSHDAVNGDQLHTLGNEVATYFGGGAKYENGQWSAPSFVVNKFDAEGKATEEKYDDVASAFAGVSSSLTNIHNEFKDEINNVVSDSLVKQDDEAAAITIGKETGGNIISLQNKSNENRILSGVVGGKLSKDSHEAVNGSQLYSMGEKVAKYLGGDASFDGGSFTAPTYKLSQVDADGQVTPDEFKDVGTAFTGLDTSIQNVNKRIKEVSQGVAQDSLNWSKEKQAFVAQHEKDGSKTNSKITSLAVGDIGKDSTDAVTGSQLYSLNTTLATYFGGDAKYEDGAWTAPKFTVKTIKDDGSDVEEKSYESVADAFAGVGTSFKNIHNEVKNEINNMVADSLVKQDTETKVIKIGGEKDGAVITIADKDSKSRTLSGVKDAEKNDEAVNKGQFDAGVTKLSQDIDDVRSVAVFYDTEEDADDVRALTRSARKVNKNSVTFGDPSKGQVGLHNVADGKIAKDSHDVINGNQIDAISQDVAKVLGGGTTSNNGTFTGPTYKISNIAEDGKVTDSSYSDVGSAFAGLDTSVKNVNQRIKDVSESVAQDSLNWSKEKQAFVAQHEKDGSKTNSKIKYLANGEISEHSTEAVTGSQLYSLGTEVAKSLGGNAKYEDGAWTAPKFTVKTIKDDGSDVEEKSYESVADAFAGVGTSFKNIHNEVKNEINNMVADSLVKQDDKTKIIKIGGEKDGSAITIADKDSKDRTLSGVKKAENDNEAVNKGQFDEGVDKLSKDIEEVRSVAVFYDTEEDADDVRALTRSARKVNKNSVTFGDPSKGQVGLHNVADGKIGEGSHDVINGNQIDAISQDLAKFLGGDAAFSDGTFTEPTYKLSHVDVEGKVEEKTFTDVGSAFAGLDTSVKNVNQRIKDVSESVAQDSLNWSKDKGAFVAQHGEGDKKANSKITSLAVGDIGKDSTDAITGGQLYSLGSSVAKSLGGNASYENGAWTAPSFKVKTVKEDGSEVEEKSYESVAEAFEGVGTSFENLQKEVTQGNTEVTENIKQNALLWSETDKAFVAQHEKDGSKTNSKIKYLANGEISEHSTEAVTGSQLYSMNKTVATYFGGGAGYNDKGEWVAPSFKLKTIKDDGTPGEEKSYDNVAEAFKGVGTSFTNIYNEVKNEIDKVVSDSLVKQDDKTHVISIGSEKSGTSINIANTDHATRTLSGVKEGSVSEESTDAINGSQLYSLNTTLATYFGGGAKYEDGAWTAPSFKVKTVKDDGSEVEEQSYASVAEAFEGVGTSFEKLHKEVTQNNTDVTENIKQNALLWSDEDKAFVAQHGKDGSKTNSKIKYLANGEISESSTEAVNGSQLYSLNQTLATYFGGDAKYEDGQWSAPTFKVTTFKDDGSSEEQSYSTVAEAFAGVSSSFTKLHNEISENIEQNALLWSDEDKAFVAVHGKGDKRSKSKLKSLLDGDISEGSTEAITGNQLYSMSNALAAYFGGGAGYKDGEWRAPEFKVAQFKSDGSSDEKKSYNDVASAFDGVSESMTSINGRIQDVEKNVSSNSLNWNEEQGSYDASHKGEASKITNVLDGKIAENSQEVVNGGQLWTTNEKVKKVEERVDTLDQHVQDIASAVTDGAVNYDKDADGKKTNKITLAGGDPGEPVMIDNVADGKIEAGSKQAVNGGQLHDYTKEQMALVLDDAKKYTDEQVNNIVTNGLNEAKSYTDMKFEALSYGIEDVRKEARQAAAIGLAVSNLRYYDIPGSLSVSFGSGIWRSQSAFAIGAGYTSEDGNIRSNLSITSAGGHWGVGAGITLRLR
ncbi:Vomp family autotransporter [Bartonella gliris]|uniref:Vomp family autotransporter n=1 Tax=Bartonella gliris TaxID=3004109 RepID=UPI00295F2803|nr:Vomp family autotransporter [Bartonella gliris]